jgi:putative transposase
MCRGNRNATVFGSEADAELFLKTLSEAVARNDWRVHSYVLMKTHYHLLLETPSPNLVEGTKWFQGTFTQRMNAMHKTWGHLFQGRYKAKVIDDRNSAYFQKVSDYIHLNPAAAGLLQSRESPVLDSYAWSSYPSFLQPP